MHPLKGAVTLILFAAMLGSCISHGPLSPDQAVSELQRAFNAGDVFMTKRLMSAGSIEKISLMIRSLGGMSDEQLSAASRAYGMAPAGMKGMTEDQFISLFIATQKAIIFESPAGIAAVKENEERAAVLLQNGNRLDFIKEGPYWRFDLTGI
jgi:hypothetical protein